MSIALTFIVLGLGVLILCVGSVMFLIAAFQESFLWALGSFLFFPVQLIFMVIHWKKAEQSVYVMLTGGALCGLGIVFGVADIKGMMDKGKKDSPQAAAAAPPEPAPQPQAVAPPLPDMRTHEERVQAECSSEIGMLCADKRGEKSQLRCLRANEDSLRASCRAAVSAER